MVDVPWKNFGLVKFPLGQTVPTHDQSQIAQDFKVVRNSSPFRSLSKDIQKPYLHKQKSHTSTSQQVPEHLLFFSKKHTFANMCSHVFPIFLVVFPWFPRFSHDFPMTSPWLSTGHWSTLKAVKDVANNLTSGGVSSGEFLWNNGIIMVYLWITYGIIMVNNE